MIPLILFGPFDSLLHAGGEWLFGFRLFLERYVMKFQHLLVVTMTAVFFSGCGSQPPLNFSAPNVGMASRKIDAELKSLTVSVARSEEKTGPLDFAWVDRVDTQAGSAQIVQQQWQSALLESLNSMLIFQDDATKKVNLSVKILKLEILNSIPKVTNTEARYEITDRKTGDLIFTQNITSAGVISISTCFDTCVRRSINLAVQNNIMQFLQVLETVDVQKPMFPAKGGAPKQ